MTITELIEELSEYKSKYGEGEIVVIDSYNLWWKGTQFTIELGDYNYNDWEYLLRYDNN